MDLDDLWRYHHFLILPFLRVKDVRNLMEASRSTLFSFREKASSTSSHLELDRLHLELLEIDLPSRHTDPWVWDRPPSQTLWLTMVPFVANWRRAFLCACAFCCIEVVKHILCREAVADTFRGESSIYRHSSILQVLLDHGKDPIPVFVEGCCRDNVELVALALAYGATIDQVKRFADIALILCEAGSHQVLSFLLGNGTLSIRECESELPEASAEGHVEALCILIKHGADVQHTKNLALLVAVRNEWPTSPTIVDLLLSHGANAYDRQGNILIRMRTAANKSEDMRRILAKHCITLP
jgi:hypothetical protein